MIGKEYTFERSQYPKYSQFQKDFPESRGRQARTKLSFNEQYHQCCQCRHKNNRSALDKRMWTEAEEGDKIEIHECSSERDEAEKNREFVEKNPMSWAVLFIAQMDNHESSKKPPHTTRNPTRLLLVDSKFYDRKRNKRHNSIPKSSYDPTDGLAWKRIVNTPARKIGPTTIERVIKYVEQTGIDYMELGSSSHGHQSTIEWLASTTHIDQIPDMKPAAKRRLWVL